MFEQDLGSTQIAARLRVSPKRSGRGKLDDAQLDRLALELDRGPAAHGWAQDQRWTLARVTVLIGRLFRVSYTPRGVSYLLHRIGWTPQVPKRRAIERDEDAIATWRAQTWAKARG